MDKRKGVRGRGALMFFSHGYQMKVLLCGNITKLASDEGCLVRWFGPLVMLL